MFIFLSYECEKEGKKTETSAHDSLIHLAYSGREFFAAELKGCVTNAFEVKIDCTLALLKK